MIQCVGDLGIAIERIIRKRRRVVVGVRRADHVAVGVVGARSICVQRRVRCGDAARFFKTRLGCLRGHFFAPLRHGSLRSDRV